MLRSIDATRNALTPPSRLEQRRDKRSLISRPELPTSAATTATDQVTLSPEARRLVQGPEDQQLVQSPENQQLAQGPDGQQLAQGPEKDTAAKDAVGQLTDEQKQQVAELQRRDREVRAHEQAHLSAAGGLATSGAKFDYQVGPDGKRYAIGGEVQIDSSPVAGDPAATLRKAERVRMAANAPASPSGQDRQVAVAAARMAAEAQQQLAEQATQKSKAAAPAGESAPTSKGSTKMAAAAYQQSSQLGEARPRPAASAGGSGRLDMEA